MAGMKVVGDQNWLLRTRQAWKMHTAFALLTASCVVYFYVNFLDAGRRGETLSLVFLSGSVLWLVFSLKCVNCGRRVVWRMLKRDRAGGFVGRLLNSKVCPGCGHNEAPEDHQT